VHVKRRSTIVKQTQEEQWRRADESVRRDLPRGVKLVRTLRGHTEWIGRIAWSPDGRMLASPSADRTIRLWDAPTGECLRTLRGHEGDVNIVAFHPNGRKMVTGGIDRMICIWDPASDNPHKTILARQWVDGVAFVGTGNALATASGDGIVQIWDITTERSTEILAHQQRIGNAISFDPRSSMLASVARDNTLNFCHVNSYTLKRSSIGHGGSIYAISFDHSGARIATASADRTVKLWNAKPAKLDLSLEGHTGKVNCVAWSAGGDLLASKSKDHSIRLWRSDTGLCVAIVAEPALDDYYWPPGLAFHPRLPILASVGSDPGAPSDQVVHIWELDFDVLLGRTVAPTVTYASAKVVIVGDSGVGKTGLGWRLAHGEFKEHASTHGQQFWLLNQLCKQRRDGAQCEAVLWDLAGQDDYRLIHALFLDDADLALLLFDPTRHGDPLSGVEFWLKQLKAGRPEAAGTPTVLVAGRSDRGTPRLTQEELEAFCEQCGITAYLPTSAKTGEGIEALTQEMQHLIPWDAKPATVTTETFKRVKDFVLDLKENSRRRRVVLTSEDLRRRLARMDRTWKFNDDEMLTAVGHLANHGYVTRLKTSRGEPRILLALELLNNLAASFVLEARRNRKGLGSLEEDRLRSGGYQFPELEKLAEAEKEILVDSAAVLFLEHNVCCRETDPLNGRAYLVFPELINLKKPLAGDGGPTKDGVAYTVTGSVENVYASLVVLMGYTQTFTRTNQWRNQARYEVGQEFVCGFRQEDERAGELDFVLYFGANTPVAVQTLFQSLFENFLGRRNLTVRRFEPAICSKGHALNRGVVRERLLEGADSAFCSRCGEKITLPKAHKPIQLTKDQAEEVEVDRSAADRRSRFEQVLFRLKTHVTEQKTPAPECFISYAWGNPEHERWVEKSLATDLQKAGIAVVLDQWENRRIGASVPRFVERVGKSDRVIVVGTPIYRRKYENNEPMRGFVVAAEGDLIGQRMIGTEGQKESVLPVLLEGTKESAFPHMLQSRVHADFSKRETCFDSALNLLLSLYGIGPTEQVATELRTSLQGPMP
jgi:small GTP-binding protein